MAAVATSAELTLLPLKPGDHLWRPVPEGGSWHALYVGQFLLMPNDDEDSSEVAVLAVPSDAEAAASLPQSVVTVWPGTNGSPGSVARLPLAQFLGELPTGSHTPSSSSQSESTRTDTASVGASQSSASNAETATVRLYTRRPRGRRAAVWRALEAIGMRVDAAAVRNFPELLPWWAIFDEAEALQPGLCATRARAVRYRLASRGADALVSSTLTRGVLAGGAVVQKGQVVLRGVRLMKAFRLSRLSSVAGGASLGGFVGQTIASSMLEDGDLGTSFATSTGGWAGGLAGAAAAAATTTGGVLACGAMSATGAVAGAGLAYAAKKALETPSGGADRSAEFHDCPLRLLGESGDIFELFDATLEFPPEDADGSKLDEEKAGQAEENSCSQRLQVAGWYAVRVSPQDFRE